MIPETICHQIYDLSYYLVSLTRILPVEIEPVKVVLLQELHDAVDKLLPLGRILHHGRILCRAFVPAADSHGDL